jgi:hypothetical protein
VSSDEPSDPDRAAILARRRRFIALAISGMATSGCKHQPPQPCLNVARPEDEYGPNDDGADDGEGQEAGEPDASGPFVEDPGVPVEGETDGAETGETTEAPPEPNPQPCLRMRPTPRPCLNVYRN